MCTLIPSIGSTSAVTSTDMSDVSTIPPWSWPPFAAWPDAW